MSLGIATMGRSLPAITLGNADEIGKRPHVPSENVRTLADYITSVSEPQALELYQ
jgi:hypothetical protein